MLIIDEGVEIFLRHLARHVSARCRRRLALLAQPTRQGGCLSRRQQDLQADCAAADAGQIVLVSHGV